MERHWFKNWKIRRGKKIIIRNFLFGCLASTIFVVPKWYFLHNEVFFEIVGFAYLTVKVQHNLKCMMVVRRACITYGKLESFGRQLTSKQLTSTELFVTDNIRQLTWPRISQNKVCVIDWVMYSCFALNLGNDISSLQNPVNKSSPCTHSS